MSNDPRFTPTALPGWRFVNNSEAMTAEAAAEEYRAAVDDIRALRGLPEIAFEVHVTPFRPAADPDTRFAVYVRA